MIKGIIYLLLLMSMQEEDVFSIHSVNQEKINRKCQSCQDEEEVIHRNTQDTKKYEISENMHQSILG
jgi:hypothetical protein